MTVEAWDGTRALATHPPITESGAFQGEAGTHFEGFSDPGKPAATDCTKCN